MSVQHADRGETMVSTEPDRSRPAQPAAEPEHDDDTARRTVAELQALTRVLFGTATPQPAYDQPEQPPQSAQPVQPEQLAPVEPAAPPPPAPVVGIPVPDGIPVIQGTAPAASPAGPAPSAPAPAAIPLPDVPLLATPPDAAPATNATADASDSAAQRSHDAPRRQAGPTPELLEEIAFLDE